MSESREGRAGRSDIIDRSVKALIRRVPQAFFRLARIEMDFQMVRPDDTAVNPPEFRADHVFIVGEESDPERWAIHVEYQLQPDARVLRGWFFKNAALTAQMDLPVILIAVYLTRGSYATFPATYSAAAGGLRNDYRFETIRRWEHADRIRGGELPELAPLLVLCEDGPTERTLQEERELILGLDIDSATRAELLAVAVTVGTRYFSRVVLESLFREELQMLKEASFVEEWIEQALEQGEAQGVERGRIAEARQLVLRLLGEKFGELPPSVFARIESANLEWCEEMAVRLLKAASLEELGL